MVKKIVVLGPESTGKSTLCAQLADHYKTSWVKEYAREYLMANGTSYTFGDLLVIAREQLLLEDRAFPGDPRNTGEPAVNIALLGTDNPGLIFIDTNMYVLKVWCEFVFDKCHHWILNQIVERKYDLYLLCDIDLPWVKDELREYPDLPIRKKLYHHYKDIMVNQTVPWATINGNYEERFQKAIEAVNKIL